jgi:hypothetical protein
MTAIEKAFITLCQFAREHITAGRFTTNHVGTAAPGCPAEQGSAIFTRQEGAAMRSTGQLKPAYPPVVRGEASSFVLRSWWRRTSEDARAHIDAFDLPSAAT